MPILYILCGPSGCGKSTWAAEQIQKNNQLHCVSRDDIRFSMLKDGEDYFSHEKEVFKQFVREIAMYITTNQDCIADATHLNTFSRCKLIQALDTYVKEYEIIYVVFHFDVGTCISRNSSRTGRRNVPETVIRNMCREFSAPTKDEDERVIDIIKVGDDK